MVGGGGGISSAEVISSFFVFASSPPRSCLLQAEVEGVVGEGSVDGAILQLFVTDSILSLLLAFCFINDRYKSVVFKYKFRSVVVESILGPLRIADTQSVSLFLSSSGSNAQGEVEGP